jgi:hypothetical protein
MLFFMVTRVLKSTYPYVSKMMVWTIKDPILFVSSQVHYLQNSVWIFHLHFQLPDLHEETCFQQKIRQAILGSSNQRKVPASLWLFLKSGKIPGLLCIGNGPEYKPFSELSPIHLGYCHKDSVLTPLQCLEVGLSDSL